MSYLEIPGLIDVHVHLRDPGATQKESFYTGTCAAVAGGVTTVLDMPNNVNPTVSREALEAKAHIAACRAVCDYGLYLGATHDNFFEHERIVNEVAGLKIYLDATHGPLLVRDLLALMGHFERWSSTRPIAVHAEGLSVALVLGLVAAYNKPVHFCHISRAEELALIRMAKMRGLPVTCEVTPHHLFLAEDDLQRLHNFGLMKPGLGTKCDQAALWEGIVDGTVDIIATDHAPHTRREKFSASPPYGVPGLETMLPLLLTALSSGRLSKERGKNYERLIELTSVNPAKIFHLPSTHGMSWVRVELDDWEIPWQGFQTKCDWSPFSGFRASWRVVEVTIRGTKVWDGEKVLVHGGFGRQVVG